MTDYKSAIEANKDTMLQSLQKLIQIPSVTGRQKDVLYALNTFLEWGREMGFDVKNYDDLGGIIEFGEGNKKTIGIIVHLDVVPEGTGWNYPPFEGKIQDGKIYGRGAIDDKGPAISALYALKAVKDAGITPKNKVQLIIGLDEESIWNTTPKLLKKIKEPDFSFVPDSVFPIVCAEKGLIWLELKRSVAPDSIFGNKHNPSIDVTDKMDVSHDSKNNASICIKHLHGGGDSLNIVPDLCEAVLEISGSDGSPDIQEQLSAYVKETNYDIELSHNKSEIKLISHGKAAHAFNCQEGQNAISQLILFLSQLNIDEQQKQLIELYAEKLGRDCTGQNLGLHFEDRLTGKMTVCPGFIAMDNASFTLKIDIRFPASESLDAIRPKVESAFEDFDADLTILDSLESLHFPEDDPHIQALLNVYQDFSGDREARPIGMGGTTFAKAFQRAVAFGPSFPGMAKIEHQPDEYIAIDHLLKCTDIYAQAIEVLAAL
ncbi:Sapep family Mn(2+)-dependent dipeptidase [Dehalobacter sp. DCM]|uniref:Sapep family Mn(2+)-dependent dipeptidase n=1 Tax=Dehalobacter sp. DCM TaxID=2907827 RepID=UPI00308168CC|nr:Sapep family Mn(2+)-dependent dipeptidase [Dehalobacter sp. DCM]